MVWINFYGKDAAVPRPFGFYLFCTWANSSFLACGALSHAPRLGARHYISRPPGGARAHLPRFSAPQPLAFHLLLLYETFARLRLADLLRSHSSGTTASSEEMASRDKTRLPPTKIIGKSYMTQGMIEDLERRGVLGVGMVRPPPEGEIEA